MAELSEGFTLEDDPFWYKDAIIYEVHVRAFFDSNDDGIGDFAGLTQKLDYLQDLGITAVWLLPFYPSPLKDDGYDIADYTNVHPSYGTLHDFKAFLREAHRRGPSNEEIHPTNETRILTNRRILSSFVSIRVHSWITFLASAD